MGGNFKFYKLSDKRQRIKVYKLNKYFYDKALENAYKVFKNEKEIKLWAGNIPVDSFLYIILKSNSHKTENSYLLNFFTTNIESQNFLNFSFNYQYYYYFILLLKFKCNDLYFPVDMCFYSKQKDKQIILGISSYFTTSYLRFLFFFNNSPNKIQFESISSIYSSFVWIERELSELNQIIFHNLKDTRRLLTDYTMSSLANDDYKTTSYNLVVEDLYANIKMLHWLYIYSFLLSCSLLAFIFYNKNLINLLLISEIIILFLFFIAIIIASFYNINFLLSFSFFLIIFGGLELALNLLILIV